MMEGSNLPANKVLLWPKLFDGVLFIRNSHLGCGKSARFSCSLDGYGDGVDNNGAGNGLGAGPHYNYGSPLG